jgi:hypothetical protein
MSVTEFATIQLTCDRKDCHNMVTVTRALRDECNRALFELGWRLCRGKTLCPRHVEAFQVKHGSGQWVECPHCHAAPFTPCINHILRGGNSMRHSHLSRVRAAK